ncbi:MAG: adenosine deaminase [Acidimicrobiia bacterium]
MVIPHVVLHDHLDGGLRPGTVLELADTIGLELPRSDAASLGSWFDQRTSGSLEGYLAAFRYTVGVMQDADSIRRVAVEAVEDLAADGAVHIESRFAPLLHTAGGLAAEGVMEAVLDGFASAGAAAGVSWGVIVDAIRSHADSATAADLAIRYRDAGVVAFDLSGPEAGYPPDAHLPAIRRIREYGLALTLHAGEAAGLHSLALAVNRCGADRIGHGIEVADDIRTGPDGQRTLGAVASVVRDRRIPLEVCPMSNLATKGWTEQQHPLPELVRDGFTVTLNTDNRLMSATTMSREHNFALSRGLDIDDLARMGRQSLAAAFCPEPTRRLLWEGRIGPGLAAEGATVNLRW